MPAARGHPYPTAERHGGSRGVPGRVPRQGTRGGYPAMYLTSAYSLGSVPGLGLGLLASASASAMIRHRSLLHRFHRMAVKTLIINHK